MADATKSCRECGKVFPLPIGRRWRGGNLCHSCSRLRYGIKPQPHADFISGEAILKQLDFAKGYWVTPEGEVYYRGWHSRYKFRRVKQLRNKHGYKVFSYRKDSKFHLVTVHRSVATAFAPPDSRPEATVVRHLDGQKENNHFSNLAWGTPAENEADKGRHGTKVFGERHFKAKLTESDVREIRQLMGAIPTQELAERFGVSQNSIRYAAKGETWNHLINQ